MKKLLAFALASCMALSLVACSSKPSSSTATSALGSATTAENVKKLSY